MLTFCKIALVVFLRFYVDPFPGSKKIRTFEENISGFGKTNVILFAREEKRTKHISLKAFPGNEQNSFLRMDRSNSNDARQQYLKINPVIKDEKKEKK